MRKFSIISILLILSMIFAACTPAATPAPAEEAPVVTEAPAEAEEALLRPEKKLPLQSKAGVTMI
jgi:PBP1b-binding outer membrane lipoprotein LpoB